MNPNALFVVSKTSRLYKFYNFLYLYNPYCTIVTPSSLRDTTHIFQDICTFVRTNLLYLIFSLPATIATAAAILVALGTCFYVLISPLIYYFDPLFSKDIVGHALIAGLFYTTTLLLYLYYKIKQLLKTDDEFVKKQPNIFIQCIKDKHDKICRQIEIVD
jgi:hypothetical protein